MPDIPASVAAKAEAIRAVMNASVDVTRNDPDLSMDGRIRRLAEAYLRAKDEMDALRASWLGTSEIQADAIDRDVFGMKAAVGADALSVRDAATRASQVADSDEAMALLQQAERTGDDVLARAVAQYADEQTTSLFDIGWGDVVAAFASRRPDVAQKLEALAAARRADADAGMDAALTFLLPKPSGLESVSDYRLQILAGPTPTLGQA